MAKKDDMGIMLDIMVELGLLEVTTKNGEVAYITSQKGLEIAKSYLKK